MEKRLLVIDDDEDIRDLVSKIFLGEGYVVLALPDVDSIFDAIKKFRPDVVLMDYQLRSTNGAVLSAELKNNAGTMDLPIVMFSAHPRAVSAMGNWGWNYFIEKPFDIEHLKITIARFVNRP
jgi:DNA-binding response OmpR family regulator